MKSVFCLLAERGHVNPYIGPAQALIRAGHEVLISSIGDLSEQMARSNLPFAHDLIISEVANLPSGKALVDLIENPDMHRALIEQFFLKDVEKNVDPIRRFLARESPDVVIIDPMHYAAVIAAETLGICWVAISSSLTSALPVGFSSPITELVATLADVRAAIFAKFAIQAKFRAVDCLSPWLNITFATQALIGSPPPDVQLVGPSLPLYARGDEVAPRPLPKDKYIIYASFGSQVSHYPEIFKKIRTAIAPLNAFLIASIGDLAGDSGWQDSASCQFYRYAPQLEILKRAALFITHGGANSVMEGIRAGVPLLMHPICNDQIHQDYFVRKAGIGRSIDLKTATVPAIESAIRDLLTNATIQTAMARVSATYQANGALLAADLITALIGSPSHPRSSIHRPAHALAFVNS